MSRVTQRKEQLLAEDDRLKRDREQLSKFLVEEKVKEQEGTNKVLDALRRTRKARGGVGEPLQVPAHLKSAAEGTGIIITDADINRDFEDRG